MAFSFSTRYQLVVTQIAKDYKSSDRTTSSKLRKTKKRTQKGPTIDWIIIKVASKNKQQQTGTKIFSLWQQQLQRKVISVATNRRQAAGCISQRNIFLEFLIFFGRKFHFLVGPNKTILIVRTAKSYRRTGETFEAEASLCVPGHSDEQNRMLRWKWASILGSVVFRNFRIFCTSGTLLTAELLSVMMEFWA